LPICHGWLMCSEVGEARVRVVFECGDDDLIPRLPDSEDSGKLVACGGCLDVVDALRTLGFGEFKGEAAQLHAGALRARRPAKKFRHDGP
jgi:hypothetical protein